jgi:cyclopropane fatty-acyl-phospholipid synthase-like methyltransferase
MRPSYANLEAGPHDVVLDIGCGTGDGLRYLGTVREYHGFDTDRGAIEAARQRRRAQRAGVHFQSRAATWEDFERLGPTRVMMSGLLHHLPDALALELLGWCARQPTVQRVATNDPVILPRERLSNFIARMDRGEHVREPSGYERLAREASLEVLDAKVVRCHRVTGLALYYLMALAPRRS